MTARHDDPHVLELLAVLATAHPHVLLLGPEAATTRVLALARPHVRPPIVVWTPLEMRDLPAQSRGTLVIPAVDAATATQQADLMAWLDERTGTVQVLSTSVVALLPRVHDKAFRERLYYRLNQICLDLV
jgi:Sigma-54 interaction domain